MAVSIGEVRDALTAKLAVIGLAAAQPHIADLRQRVIDRGGPDLRDLQSLHNWVAAWNPSGYTPPDNPDPGGGA